MVEWVGHAPGEAQAGVGGLLRSVFVGGEEVVEGAVGVFVGELIAGAGEVVEAVGGLEEVEFLRADGL